MNLREFNQGDKLDILAPSEVYVIELCDEYVVIESNMSMTEIKPNGTMSLFNTFKQLKINKGETKKVTLARTDYKDSVTLMY